MDKVLKFIVRINNKLQSIGDFNSFFLVLYFDNPKESNNLFNIKWKKGKIKTRVKESLVLNKI